MSRSSDEVIAEREPLVAEMAGGPLGDRRLEARRDRLIAVLEQHPDRGFPDACESDEEVEALYRFLRNARVSLGAVLAPHVDATRARCAAVGEVLVLHDTTEMTFRGEQPRAGLTRLGPGRHAYWVHAALAVSAEGLRAPLGLLSLRPVVRPPRPADTPAPSSHTRFADPMKESRCWAEGVAAVRAQWPAEVAAIHVMDRAGDSYELLTAMIAAGDRFVVRLKHDRHVVPAAPGPQPDRISDAVARTPVLFTREVPVSARPQGNRPLAARQRYPPRAARTATLCFTACQVALQRPSGTVRRHLPTTLPVHVIAGWESAPPAGEPPVEWRLITTDPIDTIAQVEQIVEWYRARWLIEEFFKALKTGCAYEKRQLESLDTLLVALALLAPIAWQLLLLRHVARARPDAPATAVFTPRQLRVLRAAPTGRSLPATPTLADALRTVARLGGHLRQNGDPGWLVLGRGMQKLRWMEEGWAAAETAKM